MESSRRRRVLIVANRTAATPTLLDEVHRLANEEPSAFSLLIPDAQRSEHTDWTALPDMPPVTPNGWSPAARNRATDDFR
jgi:hypothetical protein